MALFLILSLVDRRETKALREGGIFFGLRLEVWLTDSMKPRVSPRLGGSAGGI